MDQNKSKDDSSIPRASEDLDFHATHAHLYSEIYAGHSRKSVGRRGRGSSIEHDGRPTTPSVTHTTPASLSSVVCGLKIVEHPLLVSYHTPTHISHVVFFNHRSLGSVSAPSSQPQSAASSTPTTPDADLNGESSHMFECVYPSQSSRITDELVPLPFGVWDDDPPTNVTSSDEILASDGTSL